LSHKGKHGKKCTAYNPVDKKENESKESVSCNHTSMILNTINEIKREMQAVRSKIAAKTLSK
jgi:hypothetical protein